METNKSIRDIIIDKDSSELKNITQEEAQSMVKEIKEMDRIIQGLNAENAKLIQQLKEQKIDLRQSQQIMYKENQKINDNLQKTQQQLTELEERKIEELQPAAFNEIQRLRKQLQEIKNTSQLRERELGFKISKLSEEKRELQFKVNGIDKQSFDNESHLMQQFKIEAQKIQQKSQQEITHYISY